LASFVASRVWFEPIGSATRGSIVLPSDRCGTSGLRPTFGTVSRHGATVVGGELRELVFRVIYSAKNAEHQLAAHMLGHVSPLTDGEAEMAAGLNLAPGPLARAYEYWVTRLAKAEGRSASDPSVKAATAAARGPVPGGASPAKSSAKPAVKTSKKAAKAKSKGAAKGRSKR